MKEDRRNRLDEWLDLLAEEVAERVRDELQIHAPPADRMERIDEATVPPREDEAPQMAKAVAPEEPEVEPALESQAGGSAARPSPELPPATPPASHTARLLKQLALGLLALLVVINIPISRHGVTLATAMPDRRALVIRDGLVVKEEDDLEIYVYEDGRFRWISSLVAFEMGGYAWSDVHIVDDGFLEDYEMGPPIHLIAKCGKSPHIYLIEAEEKRWIVDIETFEAEGYVWDDVRFVSCDYLRGLADGETIPPGRGPAPQP